MGTTTRRTTGDLVALGLVAAAAVLFLVLAAGRITGPIGDSDEGINTAVWSYNARSLRELGPIDSRLGGIRLDDSRYATHPPLIGIETAVAQTVAGEHPWSSRAPAWIATIVALVLLYRLTRRAGIEPLPAAGAVAIVALSPMVLVYGPMLDTPVTAFPFGVAVLLCWYRDWEADHPVSPWLVGLLAVAAGLAGWQAATLAALCGSALVVRALRSKPGTLRTALPYLLGGAIGVALSLSWSWWVYGDFAELSRKFLGRSGSSSGIGLGDMVSFQVPWLFSLLSLSIVGLVGCVLALRDRRLRPLAAMSLAAVVVYAVIFRQAAAGHQYWNYWAILPAAVGWAHLLQLVVLEVRKSASPPRRASAPILAVLAIVVLIAGFDALRPNQAGGYIDDGHRAADLVDRADFPSGQDELAYVGQPYRPDAWILTNTTLAPVPLTTEEELDALAEAHPDHLVLLLGSCEESDPSYEFCHAVTSGGSSSAPLAAPGEPRLLPARDLVRGG